MENEIIIDFLSKTWFYAGLLLAIGFLVWAKLESKEVTVGDIAFAIWICLFGYFSWLLITIGIVITVLWNIGDKKVF